MILKRNMLFYIALFLLNLTIFTDFLPINTVIRLFVIILLVLDFVFHRRARFIVNPIFTSLVILNIFLIFNYFVGGDLQFIITFTVDILLLLVLTQYAFFSEVEVKIMLFFLLAHLVFAFLVQIAPVSIVNSLFSKIIINGYDINYSWRTVSGINVGLTKQPGVLSMYMVTLSSFFYALSIKNKKFYSIIGYILSIAIILLTTKRSAIFFSIITIITIGIIFHKKNIYEINKKKILKRCMILLSGVLIFILLNNKFDLISGVLRKNSLLSENNDISNGRILIWKNAFEYFLTSPIFGIGLKKYYYLKGLDIHNTYFQFLVEMGIIGFVPFVICIINILMNCIRTLKSKYPNGLDDMKISTIMGIYLVIFLVFYGFVGNTFIDYLPLSLFLMALSMIYNDIYIGVK
ncbi:O-Antigen ligase [Kandleria vitulina]|uniref:O-antigen ligase family protein n=1 Tax=Kandleria vitulina TaxID=1630 RepID=UPI0008D64793|nr:O-antigen ligase family protein [Kandleria vitulina]SEI98963.1 O-Antigen ligase [Kandleria vitulina]